MTNIFTFRNIETGSTFEAASHSKNAAARQIGIDVVHGSPLPHPWQAVSCRTPSGEVLWTEEAVPAESAFTTLVFTSDELATVRAALEQYEASAEDNGRPEEVVEAAKLIERLKAKPVKVV